VERSMLVCRTQENRISCYRKLSWRENEGYICSNNAWQIFFRK
jgi:hypothetical protein